MIFLRICAFYDDHGVKKGDLFILVYYCLQRSWGKVMFLQASVILLTGGST